MQAQPAPCDHCVSRTFSTELIIGTVLDTDRWPSPFRCLDVATRIQSTHLGSWVPVAVIALIVLLAVGVAGHHPQLSRQEATDAALSRQAQQTSHHAAKLVRSRTWSGRLRTRERTLGRTRALTTSSGWLRCQAITRSPASIWADHRRPGRSWSSTTGVQASCRKSGVASGVTGPRSSTGSST